jgi:hypothetical protein
VIGCGGGGSGEQSGSTSAVAGGAVGAKWSLNGEVILVEGAEGMTLQLSWRGNDLVTDFGGATLTFTQA